MAVNYTTTTALQNRFADTETVARLTNPDYADGDSVDTAVLTSAIEEAESTLDSYIGKRYRVPVSTSDDNVASLMEKRTLDVSQHNLMAGGELLPDAKKVLYNAAIAWAKDIAKGVAILPGAEALASTSSRPDRVQSAFDDREFTRSTQSNL